MFSLRLERKFLHVKSNSLTNLQKISAKHIIKQSNAEEQNQQHYACVMMENIETARLSPKSWFSGTVIKK